MVKQSTIIFWSRTPSAFSCICDLGPWHPYSIPLRAAVSPRGDTDSYYQTRFFRGSISWPLLPNTILCDGVEVSVGGELHAALRRLREPDEALKIWVDALCINQNDVAEKNEHVALMGEIYAGADLVHIWFGESVGNEEHATEALMTISNVFDGLVDLFIGGQARNLGAFQSRFINDERIRKMDFGASMELLDRSWFERIWVIQEVAMARKVTVNIGGTRLPWDLFSAIISTMRAWLVDVLIQPSSGPKAVAIMEDLGSQARGPREELYSLLGLLEETRLVKDDEGVVVNYALDSATIFKNFAVDYMQRHTSLDILYHCVHSELQATLTLPSWVPDWTRPGQIEPFRIRELQARAGSDRSPVFTSDENGKVLRVKGSVVDKIAVVEDFRVIPSDGEVDSLATEALWRTFMCDRTRYNERLTPAAGKGFEIFVASIQARRTPNAEIRERAQREKESGKNEAEVQEATKEDETAYGEFIGGHSKWTMNRRFFKSVGGRFGWAVDGCEPGDNVVVLFGGDYPLVMRPEDADYHTIVGDCYLHGVMNGESLEADTSGDEILIV
ncbi:heterokaryon incompatibility protein-domain-containing protein [Xylariales sp. AK1849]|nr:heterokaryon incompatibility protein-domain-containing protein [Xylariales sp. AK1849]